MGYNALLCLIPLISLIPLQCLSLLTKTLLHPVCLKLLLPATGPWSLLFMLLKKIIVSFLILIKDPLVPNWVESSMIKPFRTVSVILVGLMTTYISQLLL